MIYLFLFIWSFLPFTDLYLLRRYPLIDNIDFYFQIKHSIVILELLMSRVAEASLKVTNSLLDQPQQASVY
jgi:hypothetical protein